MHEREWVRLICERPRDDQVRLAFADWCDQSDQPHRAEFVRVQCRLAEIGHLHPPADDAGWALVREARRLCQRERELWQLYGRGWFQNRPSGFAASIVSTSGEVDPGNLVGSIQGHALIVRRGFIEELRAPLWVAQQHLPALVAREPIEHVRPTDFEPEVIDGSAWWYDTDTGEYSRGSILPSGVFHLLLTVPRAATRPTGLAFESRRAAEDALSAALLLGPRLNAGLPDLPASEH